MLKMIGSAASVLMLLAASPAIAADTPKLHPVEELCVTYQLTGPMMEGTNVQCHRRHGSESYRMETTKIKIPGMSQTQSNTSVTVGPDIYAINRDAGTATKTKNPMYEGIAKSADREPADYAKAIGMDPTGKTEEHLGLPCNVYSNPQRGDMCMTDDGITLRTKMPNMTMTATEVRRDAGNAAIYDLPNQLKIQEGPDLSQGIQGLMKQYQKR